MKYFYTFILLVLLLGNKAFSQNKTSFEHEIGFNATNLIKNIVDLGNSDFGISPYFVSYKLMKNNKGIRAGVGGSVSSFSDSNADENTIDWSFNSRLGFEWQKQMSERWQFSFGVDGTHNQSAREFRSEDFFNGSLVTTKRNSYTLGLGPVIGTGWAINKKKNIKLYTELAAYTSYNETKQSIDFEEEFIEDPEDIKNVTRNFRFSLPTNIFLTFSF